MSRPISRSAVYFRFSQGFFLFSLYQLRIAGGFSNFWVRGGAERAFRASITSSPMMFHLRFSRVLLAFCAPEYVPSEAFKTSSKRSFRTFPVAAA